MRGSVACGALAACMALVTALLSAACDLSREPQDLTDRPAFLEPIRVARDAGVTVYWLGEQFQAESLTFQAGAGSEVINATRSTPGVDLRYVAAIDGGGVGFDIASYLAASPEAEARRDRARSISGSSSEHVRLGAWPGQAFYLPAGARPVNALWLFITVDDTLVLAQASAGSNGVPGEDVNPLLDLDLLTSVIARNLREFRE